jgi:hypothetical protein
MSTIPFSRTRPISNDIAKALPSSPEAERAVLGAVLLAGDIPNSALKIAAEHVKDTDFSAVNRRVYLAMEALSKAQKPIDLVTLTDALHSAGAIDAIGGPAYVASLADGMPRVSNVAHHARIVADKSMLCQIIRKTDELYHEALDGKVKPDDLLAKIDLFSKSSVASRINNPAAVVDYPALLTMALPPVEFVIEPLLSRGGTGMMFSWRGVGKSYIATEFAVHLALGLPKIFIWPITRAYRVLYVYGEMHGGTIQERAQAIALEHGKTPAPGFLGMMSKDFQRGWRPKISSPRDRFIIEERLFGGGYEVLFLDNISTLWPSSQDGESDTSAVLQEWFTDLNQRGITVIFLHHAGKGGEQLGSSNKEHILDFVLKLRRPGDYEQDQQLRAQVKIDKVRLECRNPAWLAEFEVSLRTDGAGGAASWLTRPMRDTILRTAFGMFSDGMKPNEMYQDLGISRRTAFRHWDRYKKNADPKHWIEVDE